LYGKLEMEIILNATLSGGVAIGSSCDFIKHPATAMSIGLVAGILSSLGFRKIGPFLSNKIGLSDTCGVHSLHGMPGVFGAIVSASVIAGNESNGDLPLGNLPKSAYSLSFQS
jgi:ammonium transporter Rh